MTTSPVISALNPHTIGRLFWAFSGFIVATYTPTSADAPNARKRVLEGVVSGTLRPSARVRLQKCADISLRELR